MEFLKTNLEGRLRNTNIPKTNPLLPLFEAVINSIHSIEELSSSKDLQNYDIKVKLIRSNQTTIEGTKSDIRSFEIIDNGIGFTQDNYNSFQTLDSDYKRDKGCKGIGRLLWLKAFDKVSVKSFYQKEGKIFCREFDFTASKVIYNEKDFETEEKEHKTIIKLENIKKDIKNKIHKNLSSISKDILVHCLWYFIRKENCPKISIIDDNEIIYLDNLYKKYKSYTQSSNFEIKNEKFNITHIKINSDVHKEHSLIFSAAGRVVKENSLKNKIPGLFGSLTDENNDNFTYTGYVSSDFLTNNVNQERTQFIIEDNLDNSLLTEEISFNDILDHSISVVESFLNPDLNTNKEKGKMRFNNFINQKAPGYKPLLRFIPENEQYIDPDMSEKSIEIKLHRIKN